MNYLTSRYKRILVLDCETTSQADLKKVGAWKYAEDPSTDVICICGTYITPEFIDRRNWKNEAFTGYGANPFLDFMENADLIVAHNIEFEIAIWKYCLENRRGWPAFPIYKAYCTMGASAAAGLPFGLAGACKCVGLPVNKQKDTEGKTLIKSMSSTPIEILAQRIGIVEQLSTMVEYCAQDVEATASLMDAIPPIHEKELEVFRTHLGINARGFKVDTKLLRAMGNVIVEATKELNREVNIATCGQILLEDVNRREFIMTWVDQQAPGVLQGFTAADVDAALARTDLSNAVRAVLDARTKVGKSSTAKLEVFRQTTMRDGRIRGSLFYHGASTGRWSGRGVQPHNFPRPTVKNQDALYEAILAKNLSLIGDMARGNIWDGISSCLRSLITVREGYVLFCADFSAIEARVAFWLASELQGLAIYAAQDSGTGPDLYRVMGGKIYGINPKTLSKGGIERQLGKVACLGLQYGMGAETFYQTCRNFGIEVSKNLAAKTTSIYRREFAAIPTFWKELEQAFDTSLKNPGTTVKQGLLTIKTDDTGQVTYLVLPSRRHITYRQMGYKDGKMQYMGTTMGDYWAPKSVWGGLLAENVVQAVARDLMAEAMIRLEKLGFSVILTVHDEILAEAPLDRTDLTVERFIQAMIEKPKWKAVENLPLAAEGWQGRRWKK